MDLLWLGKLVGLQGYLDAVIFHADGDFNSRCALMFAGLKIGKGNENRFLPDTFKLRQTLALSGEFIGKEDDQCRIHVYQNGLRGFEPFFE